MMSTNHIHAVVVGGIERTPGDGGHATWGLLSDLDLVAASWSSRRVRATPETMRAAS